MSSCNFPPLRRAAKALSHEEILDILRAAPFCTLACLSPVGYPYAVPLNFVLVEPDAIYFHCATEGHKVAALRRDARVSLAVIGYERVTPGGSPPATPASLFSARRCWWRTPKSGDGR